MKCFDLDRLSDPLIWACRRKQTIQVAPGYTDSIGQALQIIGADQTVDVNSMKSLPCKPRPDALSLTSRPELTMVKPAKSFGINMNKYVATRRRFLKQISLGLGLAELAMTEMSCRILSGDASGISMVT